MQLLVASSSSAHSEGETERGQMEGMEVWWNDDGGDGDDEG
jgi:hypothetical protein